MPHPNGMPTVQEVRTMSDEELIAHLDQQLGLPPEVRPLTLIQLYEQERRSRVMLAYTQAIDRFTKQMRDMTAVILIATFVNLVLAVMVLFR